MNQPTLVHKVVPANSPVATTDPSRSKKIGQILVERGRMTAMQVERVLQEQRTTNLRFGECATRMGFVQAKDVEDALAMQFGYSVAEAEQVGLPDKVVAALNPYSPFSEALRGLRSQLMLRWFDGTPTQSALAITSVDRGDGKSFITGNLGVVFSQLGEQTLIIDADLRHPTQHQIFNLPNRMGLSGILSGRAGLEEIVTIPQISNLAVLPSGPLPPNPQELLGRPAFTDLLNALSNRYNVILIDTPSAQEASDANVVAQRAGAALIVGRKDRTKSSELSQLAGIMGNSGITILGATLNEQ